MTAQSDSPSTTPFALLRRIARNRRLQEKLLAQLARQVDFEQEHGIKPHEIVSITLRDPKGPNCWSRVKMSDGTEHRINGNVQALLGASQEDPNDQQK